MLIHCNDGLRLKGKLDVSFGRGAVVGVTGHRPPGLGLTYSQADFDKLVRFCMEVISIIEPKSMNIGMALGWDLAMAEACRRLGIPYDAYVPFKDQASKWHEPWVSLHKSLVKAARHEHLTQIFYDVSVLKKRNIQIVDASQGMVSCWNGVVVSGTGHCVNYASSKTDKVVLNVWDWWLRYRSES